jgi:hypothetical protein
MAAPGHSGLLSHVYVSWALVMYLMPCNNQEAGSRFVHDKKAKSLSLISARISSSLMLGNRVCGGTTA